MNIFYLIIPIILIAGVSSVFAFKNLDYPDYGEQFLEHTCENTLNIPERGWGHLDGWCSVILEQKEQTELLERILIEEKMQTEILDQMNCYSASYLFPQTVCGKPLNYSGIVDIEIDE